MRNYSVSQIFFWNFFKNDIKVSVDCLFVIVTVMMKKRGITLGMGFCTDESAPKRYQGLYFIRMSAWGLKVKRVGETQPALLRC
jgi:hypothetical protein